jgi:hypothetical protein
VLLIFQKIYSNVGAGVKCGCLLVKNSIPKVLELFVGQFGSAKTKPVLRKKIINNPLEIICHPCAQGRIYRAAYPAAPASRGCIHVFF